MDLFLKLFENQVSFNSMLQIGVDIIIVVLLVVILAVKKPRISKKDEAVMKAFEKIVEETVNISQKFEMNLERRQELLQQITTKLDQRIQEAQNLCSRLEIEYFRAEAADKAPVQSSPGAGARSQGADHKKVLFLAGKGLAPAEIARSLKRPVGEVELILNLKKIAS
jgi:hypothetical protein